MSCPLCFLLPEISRKSKDKDLLYIVHTGNHSEARQTGMIVLPYVAVIIITVILCLSVIIAVYLVVRRKKVWNYFTRVVLSNYSRFKLYFQLVQVVITERNPTYGNYEDGPQYNIAVDNNPRYGENVNKWEGGVVTDVNHEYQMVTDVNCEYKMAS